MIDEILEFNRRFVADKAYEPYATSKYPNKRLAILSCMDTRLTELLMAALGLHNGDAKIITNAGAVILDAFDSSVRSLLVAVYELHAEDIMVIAHTDCGACNMSGEAMIHEMLERGVDKHDIELMKYCGVDFDKWLYGFGDTERSVRDTVAMLRRHPLFPADVRFHGYIMDTVTGALHVIEP